MAFPVEINFYIFTPAHPCDRRGPSGAWKVDTRLRGYERGIGVLLPPFMGEVLERSGGDGGAPLGGANLSTYLDGEIVIRAPIPLRGLPP